MFFGILCIASIAGLALLFILRPMHFSLSMPPTQYEFIGITIGLGIFFFGTVALLLKQIKEGDKK